MFSNNVNCDIYVGIGAGKKLWEELLSAENSIEIVSPYISRKNVDLLLKKSKERIDISLITAEPSENRKNSFLKSINKIYNQHTEVNTKRKVIRSIIGYGSLLSLLLGSFVFINFIIKFDTLGPKELLLYIGLSIVIFILSLVLYFIWKAIRVYSYSYTQNFDFTLLSSARSTNFHQPDVHSKIYIIDNKIAYVGSLNFTQQGFVHNLESRVRLTDMNSIEKLKSEIRSLKSKASKKLNNQDKIIKSLFSEPKN